MKSIWTQLGYYYLIDAQIDPLTPLSNKKNQYKLKSVQRFKLINNQNMQLIKMGKVFAYVGVLVWN